MPPFFLTNTSHNPRNSPVCGGAQVNFKNERSKPQINFICFQRFSDSPVAVLLHGRLNFWHRGFKFNSNKSPTWCNNFSVYYPDFCLQLNMFPAFSRTSSGRPARPRTQHDYHHDTKVKPEAATAIIELLMIGGKTPETCWAVDKRQDNKLKNCCIRLVIYLIFTMMHGLTNLKFYI
jgi:hypothetical protein